MSEAISENSLQPQADDPIKEATILALKSILDPLLELILDTGITVHEFNKTVRERAVRVATRRVTKEIGRESKSRVAIITGLPRSEVTKILKSTDSISNMKFNQHPARRILAAWYDSPYFGTASGEPAILPIFGKRRSFERLVEKYGAGIPVRAMLDELMQMNAVDLLEDQKLRIKARVPILTGLTSRSIGAVGERARDLLETLTRNLRHSGNPLFEATALLEDSDPDMVSVVRREITEQGRNFINGATSLLNRSRKKRISKALQSARQVRLGVTVYYFQDDISSENNSSISGSIGRRKNLRRQALKTKRSTSDSQAK
jgi:hypothetical protein